MTEMCLGKHIGPAGSKDCPVITLEPIDGLTVFLGGAGMNGGYNQKFIESFKKNGFINPVYGNYTAFFKGWDKKLFNVFDTLLDASSVMFYNQMETEIINIGYMTSCEQIDRIINIRKEDIKTQKKIFFGTITVTELKKPIVRDPRRKIFAESVCRDMNLLLKADFSLSELEIEEKLPRNGQLNLIGYSWGAVIAARSAIYHAQKEISIDNLVLIGAPINKSLLDAVETNSKIKNVVVLDLVKYGDPIYAGMSDQEIFDSVSKLEDQMDKGIGHFYYANESKEHDQRRDILAKKLKDMGIK